MLAEQLYGNLVPEGSFVGELGNDGTAGKEPLYIYLTNRLRGVTQLDFNLILTAIASLPSHGNPPQVIDLSYRNRMSKAYSSELHLLVAGLPARFHATIKRYINSADAILSLHMILLLQDFGDCNIMVDGTTCHLVGVIDWAEAEVGPFGLDLSALESLSGKLHLRNGWSRYADYNIL